MKENIESHYQDFSAKYIHTLTSQVITVSECLSMNVMIMNMSSRVHISTPEMKNRLLMPYSVATFSRGTKLEIECLSETEMLLLFFDHLDFQLNTAMYDFMNQNKDVYCTESFPSIKMDQALKSFTTIITDVYPDYLDNNEFLTNKFAELAFILLRMHPAEEVYNLLSPLFQEIDRDFRKIVIDHFCLSHNVKTLADACRYPLKTFIYKFKNMFGVSPGEWIKNQKKQAASRLLTMSDASLQSIADELGMSSQQQLTRFCKHEFGLTPTEIAKNKKH